MNFKNDLTNVIEYFVYSNLYIALGAVLMVFQTEVLFEIHLSIYFYLFIFSATILSYSFHWYLLSDVENSFERQLWTHKNKKLLFILFLLSSVSTIFFFTYLINHWFWILSIAFITFLYSAVKIPYKPFIYLQKIAVEKTLYLAIVWTYITAVLPFIIAGTEFGNNHIVYVLNRFFLIYAICILFDVRDREPDRKTKIKNSITFLKISTVQYVFKIILLLFFLSAIFLSFFGLSTFQLIASVLPGILLTFSYQKSINTTSGLWYYLYLDGLMMLYGLILFIKFIAY